MNRKQLLFLQNIIQESDFSVPKGAPTPELFIGSHFWLDEDGREIARQIVDGMKFDKLYIMDNFEHNMDTLHPPTGYAATLYKKSPFCCDAFLNINLYYGICVGEL